ncbi:MAG TPA: sodium/sugar symporter [Cytophagaceae bacterium]|jgi:SSS family solute:Na+ symporter|nr:sodium/sugar symporter [Cytophagaceae bacterium]
MQFSTLDIIVFAAYCVTVIGVALYVSRNKEGKEKSTRDYFLAGNTLPWWAIGTSLIAANISAEQLIGMTGDGYTVGLAIASYELMAAATLIVVAKFFLPIFLEKKIFSMPQFLEIRYDGKVRTMLAVLWLFLYVFVNLTSILYLGGKCIEAVFEIPLETAVYCIAFFSAIYTIVGGLKAIAYTDFIQVTFLVVGGLITTYLALDQFSGGLGFFSGLSKLAIEFPDKFDLILTKSSPHYNYLPGLTVLFGSMWIANLNYWGCNQYITQRALAAKSLPEAQKGLILAGFLKLLMPMIVVVPGIIAFGLAAPINNQDEVYPWLLKTFLQPGVLGICFAALVAAVVGSLSSKTNSIATIFTMDIFKPFFGKNTSESSLVTIGRITTGVALVIGALIAPNVAKFGGGFKFIQEFTGFFSPGIFVIFIYGLFWKRATAKAALWVGILTLPVSLLFYLTPSLYAIPFLDRMGWIFLLLSVLMIGISLTQKQDSDPKAIILSNKLFKTTVGFNISAGAIIFILCVIYYLFW